MDDWDSDLVPQQFNSVEERRLCAFLNAAGDGDIEKLKIMLKDKSVSNINQASPMKFETALHYACRYKQLEVIKYLIENGADVNQRDIRGKHSLHLSSSGGHLDAVDYLIEKNAKLDIVDKYNRSCLHWAALSKNYDVAFRLLDAGAPVTYGLSNNWQPLHEGVKGGDVKVVQLLIDNGAPVNPPLVDRKVKSTVTALHVAAREGHTDCLKLLLTHKANVNAVNQGNKTPLHEAAFRGANDCCLELLLKGADPHAKDNLERTPLLEACNRGNMHCAILLLDSGSFVNHNDRVGDTSLHHLLRHNLERLETDKLASMTDILLQYGANPNLVGTEEDTVYMMANRMIEPDVMDTLHRAAEKPRTLLHIAKIACRRLLMCHYDNILQLHIPKLLQNYLTKNSRYYSGW